MIGKRHIHDFNIFRKKNKIAKFILCEKKKTHLPYIISKNCSQQEEIYRIKIQIFQKILLFFF